MISNLTKHITKALSATNDVPEQFKVKTFEIILSHLLNTQTRLNGEKNSVIREGHTEIDEIMKARFDWTSFPILSLKTTPQILLLLKIVKENFDIDELSAAEIKMILMEKFRIQKSTSAISMLLMEKLGKYVDRIPEGNKFYYRLTENGKSFVESELRKGVTSGH